MTTQYQIGSAVTSTDLGIYEADSVAMALNAMARDAGYADHAAAIEALHGGDMTVWADAVCAAGVDRAAVVRDAAEQIAADHAAGCDGAYELPAGLRAADLGYVPTYSVKRDLVVTEVRGA